MKIKIDIVYLFWYNISNGGDTLIVGVLVEIANKSVDKIFDYHVPSSMENDIKIGVI